MNQQYKTLLAFAAIYLVWGSNFYIVSLALKNFPPFLLSALRFLIGSLALGIYAFYKKEKLPGKSDLLTISCWGIVIFGGGVIAVVWAQQFLPSALASIIITTPFWFIVLDRSQWHINFKNAWIGTGLIAGITGVVLLVLHRPTVKIEAIATGQIKGILVIIAGSFFWAFGSLKMRNKHPDISIFTKTSIYLLAAGIFSLLVAALSGELASFHWQGVPVSAAIAVLHLSLVSTTGTFLAFTWLIQHKPVAMVTTYSYVNPLIAVLLGVGIGGESINSLQVVAMVIILLGVLCTNIPLYKLKIIRK